MILVILLTLLRTLVPHLILQCLMVGSLSLIGPLKSNLPTVIITSYHTMSKLFLPFLAYQNSFLTQQIKLHALVLLRQIGVSLMKRFFLYIMQCKRWTVCLMTPLLRSIIDQKLYRKPSMLLNVTFLVDMFVTLNLHPMLN